MFCKLHYFPLKINCYFLVLLIIAIINNSVFANFCNIPNRFDSDTLYYKYKLEGAFKLEYNGRFEEALLLLDSLRSMMNDISNKNDTLIFAQIYHQKGNCLYKKRKFSEAILCHDSARLLRTITLGPLNTKTGDSWYMLGNIYLDLRNFQLAKVYYDTALKIFLQSQIIDSLKIGLGYFALANVYTSTNQYNEAEEQFKVSFSYLPEENVSISRQRLTVIYAYCQLLRSLGKLTQASSLLLNTLKSFNNFTNKFIDLQYKVLNELALIEKNKGNLNNSLIFALKAVEIYDQLYTSKGSGLGPIYLNIGELYLKKGDLRNAKKAILEGISRIDDKSMKVDYYNLAKMYGTLSRIHSEGNEHFISLDYSKKALQYFLMEANVDSQLIGTAFMNLGVNYKNLKNYQEAFDCYTKANNYFTCKLYGVENSLIQNYSNLSNLYSIQNKYDSALIYLLPCYDILTRFYKSNDVLQLAEYYVDLGLIYRKMKRNDSAICNFERALKIFEKLPISDHPSKIHLIGALGETYGLIGQYSRGNIYLDNALDLIGFKIGQLNDLSKVIQLKNLIKLLYVKGHNYLLWYIDEHNELHLHESKFNFKIAVEALELYQKTIQSDQSKFLFLDEYYEIYNDYIKACLISKEYEDSELAFQLIEKSKIQFLRENLSNKDRIKDAKIPDSIYIQGEDIRLAILSIDAGRNQLMQSEVKESGIWMDSLNIIMQDLYLKQDKHYQKLASDYPNYFKALYNQESIDITLVVKSLDTSTTLIDYFVSDSMIVVYVINKDSYQVFNLRKDFYLETKIKNMIDGILIKSKDTTMAAINNGFTQYANNARFLFSKLISPFKHLIKNSVIIIPDKVLSYLPFEALIEDSTGNGSNISQVPYWIHSKEIIYSFSADYWVSHIEDTLRQDVQSISCLAMAPFANSEVDKNISMRNEFVNLPYSKLEARFAVNLFTKGDLALNSTATYSYFMDKQVKSNMILLSTHGRADRMAGENSFLVFADKKMYVREILGLKMNANLVVLSACETGTGEYKQGEGLIGLNYAFTFAGAQSICSTLWKVNDRAMSDLTINFLRLAYGFRQVRLANALRNAKLKLIESKSFSHPFFWASMVGYGKMI